MKSLLILITSLLIGFVSHAVSVTREITPLSGSDNGFKVALSFNDLGAIGGFAKLKETVPTGATVKEIDSKGGEFSFADNTVKVIWMSKGAESFTLVYHLFIDNPSSNMEVTGEFNYIVGSDKKVFEISASEVPYEGAIASTEATTTAETEETVVEEVVEEVVETVTSNPTTEETTTETVTEAPVEEEVAVVEAPVVTETKLESTSSSASSGNVYYTVQIGALTSGNYKFSSAINGLGNIEVKQYGILYKYMSGSFSSKEEALAHRLKLIDAGADGAFVVKYVNGERQ